MPVLLLQLCQMLVRFCVRVPVDRISIDIHFRRGLGLSALTPFLPTALLPSVLLVKRIVHTFDLLPNIVVFTWCLPGSVTWSHRVSHLHDGAHLLWTIHNSITHVAASTLLQLTNACSTAGAGVCSVPMPSSSAFPTAYYHSRRMPLLNRLSDVTFSFYTRSNKESFNRGFSSISCSHKREGCGSDVWPSISRTLLSCGNFWLWKRHCWRSTRDFLVAVRMIAPRRRVDASSQRQSFHESSIS